MEFDISWILLGVPVAFALGWMASRLDLRQLRIENRQAPKAYFKGLNYLLNEHQDQAIDAFIEAVQSDPDTSELHFALGNLFRRRGEYERAVRVHEHLLSRADLANSDRVRAQYALSLDFLKAGLLDRAEDALQKLEGTPLQEQGWLTLLAIYERSRDWAKAAEVAQRLQQAGQGDFASRLAHYLCEQATTAIKREQDPASARRLLEQAIQDAPDAARPRIQMAALLTRQGDHRGAFEMLASLKQRAPQAVPLIAAEMLHAARACQETSQAMALLQQSHAESPSLDVAEALVQGEIATGKSAGEAREWYVRHMQQEPSLIAAARWLAEEQLAHEEAHPTVQQSLDHAARPLARYRCAACGFEATAYFWQCPGCQAWDSFPPRRVEEL